MLVRIYGVYMLCVGSYSINLVVMENILHGSEASMLKFDIKGSRYQREVLTRGKVYLGNYNKVLKDIDFENTLERLKISPRDSQRLNGLLARDVAMLEKHGVMDYSLSISLSRGQIGVACRSKYFFRMVDSDTEFYMIAIIDYMQEFNFKKQAESYFKRVIKRVPVEDLSAVPPKEYAHRFLRFVGLISK